jgi:hypothetical protein
MYFRLSQRLFERIPSVTAVGNRRISTDVHAAERIADAA